MMYQIACGLKEDDIEASIEACAATAGVPRQRTLELLRTLPSQVRGVAKLCFFSLLLLLNPLVSPSCSPLPIFF